MKYFLFGFLIMGIGVPIISGFTNVVAQYADYLCTLLAVKAYEKSQALQEQEEIKETGQIGFCGPAIEYEPIGEDEE